jgi:hypothetical protein
VSRYERLQPWVLRLEELAAAIEKTRHSLSELLDEFARTAEAMLDADRSADAQD